MAVDDGLKVADGQLTARCLSGEHSEAQSEQSKGWLKVFLIWIFQYLKGTWSFLRNGLTWGEHDSQFSEKLRGWRSLAVSRALASSPLNWIEWLGDSLHHYNSNRASQLCHFDAGPRTWSTSRNDAPEVQTHCGRGNLGCGDVRLCSGIPRVPGDTALNKRSPIRDDEISNTHLNFSEQIRR